MPFAEPKPPSTQSSSASRSTRAWQEANSHVLRERRWTFTISAFAPSRTTTSTTPLAYASSSGSEEVSSWTTVNREPGSATTSTRQKSDPPVGDARDSEVERLLQLDAGRHVDEEPVLPDRCVVRAELVVGLDEAAEQRMVVR